MPRPLSGKPPLHIAGYGNHAAAVKSLLRNNIETSLRDFRDWLVLMPLIEAKLLSALPKPIGRTIVSYPVGGQIYKCRNPFCTAIPSDKGTLLDLDFVGSRPIIIAHDRINISD